MVRLLEKLWGARNRGVDRPRSPSQAPGRLRALTRVAPKKSARRSCRLQLEPLEDRLTPAIFMQFAPLAHVAINPGPLPPSLSVEFDPYKNLNFPTVGMSTQQEHINGFLRKQINLVPTGPTSSPSDPWFLQVFYRLDATVTDNSIPPSPFAAGSVTDTFSLTGMLTGILSPLAPTTGATWVFNGTVAEQGTLNGVISLPDPTTGNQTGIFQCQNNFGEKLTVGSNGAQGGSIGGAPGATFWQEQVVLNSQGNLMETLPPGGAFQTATFWQQDQATECLMQVIPFHPPSPCITIDAVFNTWGSMTEKVLIPQTLFTPEVDIGTTHYTDSLTEMIMMPDGSMQTVAQTSMDMGSFVEFVSVPDLQNNAQDFNFGGGSNFDGQW